MRELTRREVVAMWVWHAEYAASGKGAIDWYAKTLTRGQKRSVEDFIEQYEAARKREVKAAERATGGGKHE